MTKSIEVIKQTRAGFIKLMDGLTIEELNEVPANFKNNIIWNFGHVIITQQTLCYLRADLQPKLDDALITKYKGGSKPESFIDNNELKLLKEYAFSTLETLENGINNKVFSGYNSFITGSGIEITGIEDVVKLLMMHDGMHLGYAMAIKKMITK